jgi:regulator of protease activity HflC (stomatin/prohibitin superfamily)
MKHIYDRKDPSGKNVFTVIIAIFVVIILFSSIKVIDDGQVGVKKTLGHIADTEVGTGLTLIIPIIQSLEIYDVKTQEIKETSMVPSSEGLIITLDASVLYHLEASQVAELRKSVNKNFKETLIIPYIRNEIRDTVSAYEAKVIYSQEGRKKVALQVKENLIDKLGGRGIVIEDVLLRDIILPEKVTSAIELKLEKEQEAQRKEFELVSAIKDAEIEVARARGVSEANKIISGSISSQYIQYLWVQGLNDGNSEVIYVPTEANLPILEASRTIALN